MKLTPRQRTFVKKLVELYRRNGTAVHYSLLARELGVNKFSAYDMLRVLEGKGLVRSDYVLGSHNTGPGRSQVVFAPTPQAVAMADQAEDTSRPGDDWQFSRQRLLDVLGKAGDSDSWEAVRDLLARLPSACSPLTYCSHLITALVMNFDAARRHASDPNMNPLNSLRSLIPSGDMGLSTLIGFSLGSSLSQRIDSSLLEELIAHTKNYQSYLLMLNEESKAILSEFLRDALAVVEPTM